MHHNYVLPTSFHINTDGDFCAMTGKHMCILRSELKNCRRLKQNLNEVSREHRITAIIYKKTDFILGCIEQLKRRLLQRLIRKKDLF